MKSFAIILALLGTKLTGAPVQEKDLAIIIDTGLKKPIKLEQKLANTQLMPEAWFETIKESFRDSPVRDALAEENLFSDWQIVSTRIVPCNPLVRAPSHSQDIYCWPEFRIVAQPVISNFRMRSGFIADYYADDRAVHMLYDVPAALVGSEATELSALKSEIIEKRDGFVGTTFEPLSEAKKQRFVELRNKLSQSLLRDSLEMREKSLDSSEYQELGSRPELNDTRSASLFRKKYIEMLGKYALPSQLKKLTGFSLPEGREPANSDQWIFVAFKPSADGNITKDKVDVFSRIDGRKIFELPHVSIGSMLEDSEQFYDLDLSDPDYSELNEQVFLFDKEQSAQAIKNIASPELTTVDNSSCASCHRLNETNFNFHNLSKLETEVVNISPRVVNDVKYDLKWIKENLK